MSITRMEQVSLPYLSHPAWWATLQNGHQIFVVYKPGDVVHIHTVVRTGSVNETDENTGVSHFLEHLMFKGTDRYPVGAFDRILEGVGGRVNASTSKDLTQFYVTIPKGEVGEYYRLALDLHADMLLHAALPDEEIGPTFAPKNPQVTEKRERMVVIEEIKMGKDNPWRNAIQQLTEELYPTHPYRREIIGTAEVIATIPRAKIVEYYQTWYQPSNMITIVTGDLDPEETIHDVERNFDFHTVRPVTLPTFSTEQPPTAPRVTHLNMPLNVAYVVLGYLGPASIDLRSTIALDVLSLILGEGKSSRMQLRLVEQLPNTPFIEAGSSHWTYRDSSNVLGYGIARPDAVEASFDLLRKEVERLHTEPPTADELEKAVTRLEGSFAAQAETAAGLSYAVADSMARLNNPTNYTEYLPILRSLTRDDLAMCAATYLPAEHLCAVTVSPE
ncbi:MAG TPA: pitrilysin family protein [Armatimonadota bacterium]|nr:pitrilysin family protein [Armatimonadota bacterium]